MPKAREVTSFQFSSCEGRRDRIQCRYCGNPDRDGAPCRYTWWRPWLRRQVADEGAPCYFEREDETAALARRRTNRNTLAFIAFVAVMALAWWAMAGGLEWTHLHLWMGPGLRP